MEHCLDPAQPFAVNPPLSGTTLSTQAQAWPAVLTIVDPEASRAYLAETSGLVRAFDLDLGQLAWSVQVTTQPQDYWLELRLLPGSDVLLVKDLLNPTWIRRYTASTGQARSTLTFSSSVSMGVLLEEDILMLQMLSRGARITPGVQVVGRSV